MRVDGLRHAPRKIRYLLYRRLGGPQGRSGRVRKIWPPPGFDPRTVQPVSSRYTDWSLPAHNHKITLVGYNDTRLFITTQNIQSPSYLMQRVYWFMYSRVIWIRPHAGEKVTPSAAAAQFCWKLGCNRIPKRFRWSRGKRASLWYPSSRVQTRPKPSEFSGEKNPQRAFLRKGK